jgi:uncharacterized protein (TIGR00730 family)
VARPRTRHERLYTTGDADLDRRIREFTGALGLNRRSEMVQHMLSSVLRLGRGETLQADLKLVNAALREFAFAAEVFAPYRGIRKVSVFGSSRAGQSDADYACAREFAARIVQQGWMVVTGAGPGIMQAAQDGAGARRSFGLNIRLPFENDANPIIEDDPKLITFNYFFTRKVTFLKESDAFVLLPGGFGTLDETFELLTLVQTGKSDLHPVVLLEQPGGTYWKEWRDFVEGNLARRGLISLDDMNLLHFTHDVGKAVREVTSFYRNYQSQRYVGNRLVLRLLRAPGAADLARLRRQFRDLLAHGTFEVIEPLPVEVTDNDALDYARIAFRFNRRSYGRLRAFVDALNEL